MEQSDISIIGCGVAGTFAAFKIAERHKNVKCNVFEIGRKWMKRRRQLEGFLGCFPTGNGKIIPANAKKLSFIDGRKIRLAQIGINNIFNAISNTPLTQDNKINSDLETFFHDNNFTIDYNDYYQWKPENVHKLSRYFASVFEQTDNLKFHFDSIVDDIDQQDGGFKITTRTGEYSTKKIILAVGRSGWRWASELFTKLGLKVVQDTAEYGLRIELPTCYLKKFNYSECNIYNDDFSIGPMEWNGTIIPEDHSDLVISAFRSNEERWKSEHVSFPALVKIKEKDAYQISERIGKLTFLLFNDRVGRERLSTFMKKNSILSLLPEFNILYQHINMLNSAIPDLIKCASIHAPTINPIPAGIKIHKNLESDIPNLFLAGECARIPGIYGAALSGTLAANFACK